MSDGLDNCVSELMRLADSYNRAVAERDEAIEALRLLADEVKLSGNWTAKDYGWPQALTATQTVLSKHPPKVTP